MSDFIVPAIAPRIRHLASGPEEARRVFSFPFPAVNAADIAVHRDGTLLDGGYVIAFAEDRQGGTITFDTAVPAGVEIVILRSTVIERATDFVENGAFRASTLNLELDRLTMIAQELDLAGRAGLHRDPTEIGPDLVLPAPPARANGLLGFSADGQALAVLPVESLRGERGETGPQGPAGDMSGVNNLSELTDTAMARANLDAPSRAELTAGLNALDGSIRNLDLNLALNTLQDSIEAGWTTLAMVDGFADEFEDQSGISVPYTDVTTLGSASASSVAGPGYPAANALTGAVDGWASDTAVNGSWWQVTFPSARRVSRIDVATAKPSNTTSGTLKPQYHNGSAWVDLAVQVTITATPSAPHSFTFAPVEATQFRLIYSAGSSGYAYLFRAWFYEGVAGGLSSGQAYDAAGDYFILGGLALVDRTIGTAIGTYIDGGGLATAFDASIAQNSVQGPARGPSGTLALHAIGKQWPSARVIGQGQLTLNNSGTDRLLHSFTTSENVVVELRGSNSNDFAAATVLGTLVTPNVAGVGMTVTVTATDTSTAYTHHWITVRHAYGGATASYLAEAAFWDRLGMGTLASIAWTATDTPVAARAALLVEPIIGLTASINVLTGGTASGSVSGAGSVVADFPFLTDGLVSWVEGTALDFRYDLGDGNAVRFRSYEVQVNGEGSGRYPTGWQIYGSNDGTAWTLVDTVSGESGWSDGAARTYIVDDQTTAWRHFRFLLTGYVGAMAQIRNLQLFPVQEPDPTDVIVLNTDLICEVSRDDGESWTALALSREVTFESGLELLAGAETSLEMQPAGTAMRIRLKTPTSRRIRVKGWAMQWR